MKRTIRHASNAAVSLAVALTLAACGSSDHSGGAHESMSSATGSASVTAPAASADHNAADVTFATDMIPHHQQAVEMADLAAERASDAQVKRLAVAIKAAQDPEIQTMSGWLSTWGQPVPSDTDGHDMSDMDHGDGATMEGMMTDEEMQRLAAASGAAFDRLWLELMIKHHMGAVAMAETATASGKNADVVALAQEIITAQKAEIATMQQLLPTITG
ncbi:uncharacterized protein (DUF305 family) [Humibacillus xanthopallidus]|uniref:Uncharacterized protein (DUF305 family) n=1 Tax=Humibacillus xanthopallidus TaxID=412689 RepID=A0A543PMK3_9MICO|nr:DUF305 domain-containing protein [Humibacillus xanthopallidus]TQN45315.1 uncharacterized protein (DUF305 family) [Humibacillus xanthopallidus]